MSQPAPLAFTPADGPVREPVTKIGGQPVWQEEPQWPLSRETGEPMRFLGQFALDGGRLACLFMTGHPDDDWIDGTWEPEGGENAVVIQPGGRIPDFVSVRAQAEGPTAGPDHLPRAGKADTAADTTADTETDADADADRVPWQFLGGPGIEPRWLQGEEEPGEGWRLVVQLTDGEPFFLNFGDAGIGYAFLSPDGKEGRFLWQCA
ncbi:hypothetical protein [Streptomyces chattanoogensis]|uniref:DUF1963 domain-containing protein n=1 Tax=Streptomyces chattanoogensis TaxID=66876 RepID=A0A0N0XQE2_9ACTN|nr:hypothetical protein [Streptomyces chattanoogensis]KPC58864.1 hypothetical protein ADL29_37405 [Streptomyces chattanoogensis]